MRRLARPLLALFLLWHVTAVTVYALPSLEFLPAIVASPLRAVTRPYVLLTGQWQRWNAFAPDPPTTVPFYLIEADSGTGWTLRAAVQPATLSPRVRPSIVHIAEDLWRQQDLRTEPLAARFVEDRCAPLGIAPDTPVRLHVRTIRMPIAADITADAGTGALEIRDVRFVETRCPSVPSALIDPFPAVRQ